MILTNKKRQKSVHFMLKTTFIIYYVKTIDNSLDVHKSQKAKGKPKQCSAQNVHLFRRCIITHVIFHESTKETLFLELEKFEN